MLLFSSKKCAFHLNISINLFRYLLQEPNTVGVKKCFPSIMKKYKNGDVCTRVQVNDSILVKPSNSCCYYAKVKGFFKSLEDKQGKQNIMASVIRYYRSVFALLLIFTHCLYNCLDPTLCPIRNLFRNLI